MESMKINRAGAPEPPGILRKSSKTLINLDPSQPRPSKTFNILIPASQAQPGGFPTRNQGGFQVGGIFRGPDMVPRVPRTRNSVLAPKKQKSARETPGGRVVDMETVLQHIIYIVKSPFVVPDPF